MHVDTKVNPKEKVVVSVVFKIPEHATVDKIIL